MVFFITHTTIYRAKRYKFIIKIDSKIFLIRHTPVVNTKIYSIRAVTIDSSKLRN